METIKYKNYQLFPGELLWVTGSLYFTWFILSNYNPIRFINGVMLLLLSIYSLGLSILLFIEIQKKMYRILNIFFSWFINVLDGILNYMILKGTYGSNSDGFIIWQKINPVYDVWFIIAIMIFKIGVSSIVIICIERGFSAPLGSLQGMKFFELQAIPYKAIENNSAYRVVKSLFSKNSETLLLDIQVIHAYYKVFYQPLCLVIMLLVYVFFNNLSVYFIEPIRPLFVSAYIIYGLIIGIIIMPVFLYIYYKKKAN
ncbi:MAG: hypothetical protein AB1404_02810 [Spirochaetota bacterium]|uniref:Uncharacterized protein n=1 Tax=Gracilinema caldarium TaxID=215591 RepID=A0A7C3EHB7_9SPIR|nr:hypothetical protein [Spirochaetota bacterium]